MAKQFPNQGITKEEFKQFFDDIKPILIDLEAISTQTEFENYHFIGMHILNYETKGLENGVNIIDEREGVELLSMVQFISRTFKTLSKALNQICEGHISKGNMTHTCAKQHILPIIKSRMHYTPHLVDYLSNIEGSEEEEAYNNLLFEIGKMIAPNSNESIFVSTHLVSIVLTLLYQEVMFTKFDVNSNTYLDHDELIGNKLEDPAFLYYEGLVQDMIEKETGESDSVVNDFFTEEVFSSFIANKEKPTGFFQLAFEFIIRRAKDLKEQNRLDLVQMTCIIVQTSTVTDEASSVNGERCGIHNE